jgi:hypothetical protein
MTLSIDGGKAFDRACAALLFYLCPNDYPLLYTDRSSRCTLENDCGKLRELKDPFDVFPMVWYVSRGMVQKAGGKE